MPNFPTLYSRDSHGNVREWHMQVNGSSYRTVSGILDGTLVVSEWKQAYPMNEGKANATTAEEQALNEIDAKYALKLRMKYHEDQADIDTDKFFKPMLAESYTKRYTDKGKSVTFPVAAQPKLDGIRCIMTAEGAWSRTGKPILAIPHIIESLSQLFRDDPDLVLDGELYNHDLRDDFNEIISLVRKQPPSSVGNAKKDGEWADGLMKSEKLVQYHVYDMPSYSGGFDERSDQLAKLTMDYVGDKVQVVDTQFAHTQEELDETYSSWMAQGYEGQMVRLLDSEYEQKRSKGLLKRKEFMDTEFEIVAVEEGQGNWAGYAKSIKCKLPDGRTFGSGVKGNQEYARNLLENADAYVGKQVTVRYQNLTPDGIPRFPIAVALHMEDRW